MLVYLSGLALGLSLVTALGPQNIFLIRQGVLRQYAVLSAAVCWICDIILVSASVVGLHQLLNLHPFLKTWITWAGALFLFYYGLSALSKSLKKSSKENPKLKETPNNRLQIILLAVGFSLLNPHAIIDTLIIIGGSSSQFPGHQNAFFLGVITSSFLWLMLLTFVTQFFSEILARETVWRRLEFGSGILMIFLGAKLILM
ncbi:LysE family transporter [Legionella busanensis]|uniref:LysE family transporter n=1 Tax=Legionella busanensis TaxID=190655 RepID=A0A378JH55_9GAMM|nr:LysE family transporter [Legionella busanensis]STX50028.1 LysE family transporter [Legionella busanensis]